MREINNLERRNRLAVRHRLSAQASTVEDAASAIYGFHSSDPATVYLSAWARVSGFEVGHLEDALYEERSLVRILGMRRTMFVVPVDTAPEVHCSSTMALIAGQQKRLADLIEAEEISTDGQAWVEDVSRRTLAAIEDRGAAAATELTKDVPELGDKLIYRKKDGTVVGSFGVSTRILFLLATEGRIIRARPKGTWVSALYRWTTVENWIGGSLTGLDPDRARVGLLGRWLGGFGPATESDIKWWTGWNLTQVRRAIEELEVAVVTTQEGQAYVMADDIDPVPSPGPWVALLPSLDPTVMGWKERGWYLTGNEDRLFDRNGNAGPTVWADGLIVGGWGQRENGQIALRLLEDVGTEKEKAIEQRADQLERWLDGTIVKPRFRSPLDKELAGG